jgi:hypothetical protein
MINYNNNFYTSNGNNSFNNGNNSYNANNSFNTNSSMDQSCWQPNMNNIPLHMLKNFPYAKIDEINLKPGAKQKAGVDNNKGNNTFMKTSHDDIIENNSFTGYVGNGNNNYMGQKWKQTKDDMNTNTNNKFKQKNKNEIYDKNEQQPYMKKNSNSSNNNNNSINFGMNILPQHLMNMNLQNNFNSNFQQPNIQQGQGNNFYAYQNNNTNMNYLEGDKRYLTEQGKFI